MEFQAEEVIKFMSSYSLLIVSQIPVQKINDVFYSLDLWCKDINTNAKSIKKLGLLCPISKVDTSLERVDTDIIIYSFERAVTLTMIDSVIQEYDVVQLGAGRPFWHCRNEILAFFYAKKYGKSIIFSISSNRVKSTLLNSADKPFLKKLKGQILALSISLTQKFFSKYSDGVLLVGHGLKDELSIKNKHIHIATASWVTEEDVIADSEIQAKLSLLPPIFTPRLCIFTRLEKMKGVHLAIEMLALLKSKYNFFPILSIYGKGPERESLEELANELDLLGQVLFKGTVSYGVPFFNEIKQYDLILLTNLGDEQPRLIFDSISQGVLPICPNTDVYKATGCQEDLLYMQGSATSLAEIVKSVEDKIMFSKMIWSYRKLLASYTIDEMHAKREIWIKGLL